MGSYEMDSNRIVSFETIEFQPNKSLEPLKLGNFKHSKTARIFQSLILIGLSFAIYMKKTARKR